MRPFWLGFLMTTTVYAAAGIHPEQLRCEYRANPQGIDVVEPRLSWVLLPAKPTTRGLYQTAYRVLVSSSEQALGSGNGDLWDSGKVQSDQSIHVVYRGHPLTSGRAAYWKIQVWDQDGQASEWSQPAQWSMGLLRPEDWHGQWIGRDETGVVKDPGSPYRTLEGARWIWDAPNAGAGGVAAGGRAGAPAGDRFFRETLTVPADRRITRAICIVGADNEAQVFFNGELIAANSGTGLPVVKDVVPLIHAGENTIAVRATHSRADTGAGLIGAVLVEFASGEPLLVQTSGHWHTTAKPEPGWENPGFLDVAWPAAKELGAYGMAPWGAAGFAAEHRLPARLLRKEFAVAGKIRRATVSYCGLGLSELYLNGAKVGDHVLSPGLTDYDKHLLYETFDVTGYLTTGANAIGLMLGNGRYYAPRGEDRTRNFGYPKAILQLDIEKEDGSRSSVVTDETWKLSTAGPIRANPQC